MHSIAVIMMIVGLPVLVIIGVIVIALAVILRRSNREANSLSTEETRMMQEIYSGLEKMDSRIESLEAILVEANRKENDNE